jgi:hypothetical protein
MLGFKHFFSSALVKKVFVLAIFFVVFPSNQLQAYRPDRAWAARDSAGIILPSWAIRHIQERHWPGSPAAGAGKYNAGMTVDLLHQLIDEAVTKGVARLNTNGRPGTLYEYDFHRQIGTKIHGEPATRVRVVLNQKRQVVTAFPF